MQELIVVFIVLVSCGILYKYSFPYTLKFRIRLYLAELSTLLHADTLARKIHPGNKPETIGFNCHGCNSCHTSPKTTSRPVRIFRKNNTDN